MWFHIFFSSMNAKVTLLQYTAHLTVQSCVLLQTWISLVWYNMMSPRRRPVERLIRPFRTYEYIES